MRASMTDSSDLQRAIADNARANGYDRIMRDSLIRDSGNNPIGLAAHKPGSRFLDAGEMREAVALKNRAYADAAKADEIAWRMNDSTGEFVGGREGDACTVRFGGGKYGPEGSPGHLEMIGGKLLCVADPEFSRVGADEFAAAHNRGRGDSVPTRDAAALAYEAADFYSANAYLGESWLRDNTPDHLRLK